MPLTLVVGPPCGGKTTWVEQQRPGLGAVVDFDLIAVELGSLSTHDHPQHIFWRAIREQQRREALVSTMACGAADLFVVRTLVDPVRHGRRLGADQVVVCAPPQSVVEARARSLRPPRAMDAVRQWYAERGEQENHVERISLR